MELLRVKRRIVHDKQLEMPIREIKDNTVYHRVKSASISARDLDEKVTFNDPFYPDMWYLDNEGQSGGEKYLDMNVQVAWANGFTGEGVVVCILDDGIRVLDGAVTDSLEAEALRFNSDYIDIFSASWGPSDDGATMEAPHKLATDALQAGVQTGRNGLGNIYVWATGNGGMNGDDCNADGYTSSVETLSVGSITDWGRQPFYMENCTSTLAVVPTGGEEYKGQEYDLGQIKLKVVFYFEEVMVAVVS
nr:hypothetical protein BaRGS_013690 [Batillaria attramentaria]